MKHRVRARAALIILLAALPFSLMVAVTFGPMPLTLEQVYTALLQGPWAQVPAQAQAVHNVVWLIRLPRLGLSAGVGAALSVCGVLMQAVVRNPLADPYLLGISSGGTLGATAAILLGVGTWLGSGFVGLMAFFGSLGAAACVLLLAGKGLHHGSVRLLLSGTAVSALCGAVSNMILFFSHESGAATQILHWQMGGTGGASWQGNGALFCVLIPVVLFLLTQGNVLNVMLLGDEAAQTLGVDLSRKRWVYLIMGALLAGFSVSQAGMVGFVGLVIPHVVRACTGNDHRTLIPLSALLGAVFLVWADVLCRSLIPGVEIPIGVLTALLGAPFFLYLILPKRYGYGGETV